VAATKTASRARPGTAKPKRSNRKKPQVWKLRLFVAGQSPKSIYALANLKELCEKHLKGQYQIEVIDLLEFPHLARGNEIVALPALATNLPHAVRQIIGDLSNSERVLVGLALQPVA
jgi:circadian clock protein KaiB